MPRTIESERRRKREIKPGEPPGGRDWYPRSEKFAIDPSMPQRAMAAWEMQRKLNLAIAETHKQHAASIRRITADNDLRPEARIRRANELSAKAREPVLGLFATTKALIEATRSALSQDADACLARDPLADVVQRTSGDKAARALAELLAMSIRRQAQAEVFRELDVALEQDQEGKSPGMLLRVMDRLARDPLAAHILQTEGRERIAAEASPAQLEIFDQVLDGKREARLDEDGKLALDHRDALGAALTFVEAIEVDFNSEEFFQNHELRGSAIDTAREFFPVLWPNGEGA